MVCQTTQPLPVGVWALVEEQNGVVTRAQLLALGFTRTAIRHRVAKGRLHPIRRGVFAVGRPRLGRHGIWMAAVLSCGPGAALSHASAAALWRIRRQEQGLPEVSVPAPRDSRSRGITVHRRRGMHPGNLSRRDGIPVTSLVCTLVDLAPRLSRDELEAAISEADRLDLADPETLRTELDRCARRPGAAILRETLDERTFTLTDSQLERRFLALVRAAGLLPPVTGRIVHGYKVDFYWPDVGLVVETDGLRYHRTPAQQARDRMRDQTLAAAGLTTLRFTHAQVAYEPAHVTETLTAVTRRRCAEAAQRLRSQAPHGVPNRAATVSGKLE